jgi:hypothetical protein
MFRFLQQVFHGRKDVAVEPKTEVEEMPKPSKEAVMNVFQRFKLNATDRLVVKKEDEPTVAFLKNLGLVTTEVEYSLNPRTGVVEQRKMARWVSWNCEDCAHFFVGDMKTKPSLAADEVVLKNVPQCRKGFSMEFRDGRKGKRCPYFEDKRLLEVLNDGVE